jgi:hypothetical protein
MKALVYHGPDRKEDVPAPEIVGDTDVLISVELTRVYEALPTCGPVR